MVGLVFTALVAIGCFLFTISLPARSAGDPLRRLAFTLIAIPFAAIVFFGLFVETVRQSGVRLFTADSLFGILLIGAVAFVLLRFKRRISSPRKPFRIREKRPVDPSRRGGDLLSYIRDHLGGDDE